MRRTRFVCKLAMRLETDIASKTISGGVVHDLPADMQKALRADAKALAAWEDITPLARNEWICWVTIVKKDETRKEHVERLIAQLKEGIRRPCCWPGCPHRNPKNAKWFGAKKAKNRYQI